MGILHQPQTQVLWFVVFWLPFNILFVTLYLGSVAHVFVRISNKNVARIERNLREQEMQKVDTQEAERHTYSKAPSARFQLIKQNSISRMSLSDGSSILTGRDLLQKLYLEPAPSVSSSDTVLRAGEGENELSSRCKELFQEANTDGNFTLRLAVFDRVVRIACANLLDFDALLEVDGERIFLTVESLRDWITNWKIPHRARHAYRTVVFESMLFVGEKQVFEHGIGAFLDLSVVEFVELFSPFVFALQDKESMEQWLADTADNAMEFLPDDFHSVVASPALRDRRTLKNTIENYFPCNSGNAVRIQL